MSGVRAGQLRVVTKLSCIGDGVSSLDENKEFFMVGVGTPYLVLAPVNDIDSNRWWTVVVNGNLRQWRETEILNDELLEEP